MHGQLKKVTLHNAWHIVIIALIYICAVIYYCNKLQGNLLITYVRHSFNFPLRCCYYELTLLGVL